MTYPRRCALDLTRPPVFALTGGLLITTTILADCPPTEEPVAGYVVEGAAAPGTDDRFQSFDRPALCVFGGAGAIAFTADTDGPTSEDDVVYRDLGGLDGLDGVDGVDGLELVAREGAPAPGIHDATFASFTVFDTARAINIDGAVVFVARLDGPPPEADTAIYLNDALVVREGDQPRGIGGRSFQGFAFAGVTDHGEVGFLGDLDGAPGDDSVIVLDGEVLYRQGDAVPGLDGETWDADFNEVQWNANGDLVFAGNTSLPSAIDVVVFRRVLDRERGADDEIVAQEGQPIAARDGDDFLDSVQQLALAGDAGWAMRGALSLAPINADAIVLTEAGFYAQEGDPVHELPGVVLGTFGALAINARGDVVYTAELVGDTPPGVDEGLFAQGCLLMTDGGPVPGLPEGTVFNAFGFEDLVIDDAGRVMFAASYGGETTGDGLFTLRLGDRCEADLDGDRVVGFGDLVRVLVAWGVCESSQCSEDINGDGFVDGVDLLAVLSAWGPCP